jgi:hypothetical protein
VILYAPYLDLCSLSSSLSLSLAFLQSIALSHSLWYHCNLNIVVSLLQAVGGRPRRFGVQCRVLLPVEGARERGEEEKAMWCLIFEDQAPGLPAQEKGEEEEEKERKKVRER